jgi:hypothetical protein
MQQSLINRAVGIALSVVISSQFVASGMDSDRDGVDDFREGMDGTDPHDWNSYNGRSRMFREEQNDMRDSDRFDGHRSGARIDALGSTLAGINSSPHRLAEANRVRSETDQNRAKISEVHSEAWQTLQKHGGLSGTDLSTRRRILVDAVAFLLDASDIENGSGQLSDKDITELKERFPLAMKVLGSFKPEILAKIERRGDPLAKMEARMALEDQIMDIQAVYNLHLIEFGRLSQDPAENRTLNRAIIDFYERRKNWRDSLRAE